ncbi:hypothetical protein N7470_010092 [Penicillium chermesinum]|nr:hypothetical protein N7470_010092 [Penicillium chermesinum]
MVTQGSSNDLVETEDIPEYMKDLYAKACEEDRIMAMSLSIPANRRSTTMLVQGKGREVIAKVEELSADNPTRKERGLEQHGIKPAVLVYSSRVKISSASLTW